MKIKVILVALSALLSACSALSGSGPSSATAVTSCPPGAVHGDQELVRYAGCVAVAGDLEVADVSSLDALAELRHVAGTFTLQHTRLYRLSGLEQLRSVKELRILHNPKLISIGSLNGLALATSVTISGNPRVSKSYGFLKGLEPGSYEASITKNLGLQAEGIRTPDRVRIKPATQRLGLRPLSLDAGALNEQGSLARAN